MRTLIAIGVIVTPLGVVAILTGEGTRGLKRLFDLQGAPPNKEPSKRLMFHAFVVGGSTALLAAAALWLVRAL